MKDGLVLAEWVDPSNPALLVVDVQNDLDEPGGGAFFIASKGNGGREWSWGLEMGDFRPIRSGPVLD